MTRPWTHDDDRRLHRDWGLSLRVLAERLGRTECAVRFRAARLGLPFGIGRGYESLAAAAERVGYHHESFRRALRWYQWRKFTWVDVCPLPTVAGTRRRGQWRQIDPDDADLIARAYTQSELPGQASARLGLPPFALRRWAVRLGHTPPPRGHLRLMPEEWDAVAEHARARRAGIR